MDTSKSHLGLQRRTKATASLIILICFMEMLCSFQRSSALIRELLKDAAYILIMLLHPGQTKAEPVERQTQGARCWCDTDFCFATLTGGGNGEGFSLGFGFCIPLGKQKKKEKLILATCRNQEGG